jgi:hypothetical protein
LTDQRIDFGAAELAALGQGISHPLDGGPVQEGLYNKGLAHFSKSLTLLRRSC